MATITFFCDKCDEHHLIRVLLEWTRSTDESSIAPVIGVASEFAGASLPRTGRQEST
jgi:hypothetical protein